MAGYGKFGRIAVERLRHAGLVSSVLVVEPDPSRTAVGLAGGVSVLVADAAQYLARATDLPEETIIIPTAPFNLAARFLLATIPEARQAPIPAQLSHLTPNPRVVDESNLCCSRADFLCPDACPEGDRCAVTGELRNPLCLELEKLRLPGFKMVALRSSQILPGVGGYLYRDLCDLRNRVSPGLNLVATSCKCHGIITALRIPTDENP